LPKIFVSASDWLKHWRIEVFSVENLSRYGEKLVELVEAIEGVARRHRLDPKLLMLVFEVFWSVYFGPIMPWKAGCSYCLANQLGICRGGAEPFGCVLAKALRESRRVARVGSPYVYVRVEPPILACLEPDAVSSTRV